MACKDVQIKRMSASKFFGVFFCISFGNKDPTVWIKAWCLNSSVTFPEYVMVWGAMLFAGVFYQVTGQCSHVPGDFMLPSAN